MKAAIIEEKGLLDNIRIVELPIPLIKPNEILIKVKAAGVNPVDWKAVLNGIFKMPHIIGTDVSGIIEKVGTQITNFKEGDEIIGSLEWATQGAFAEYITTEENFITHKPKNLNFKESAGIPLAALTAWQGLFDKLDIQPDQKVLIQAAAGGVGLFAVQFAKWKGAHVTGIASEKNEAFLREIGVDEIINYKTADFNSLKADYDAVFDSMASSENTFKILKHGGKYVSITAAPSQELANQYGVKATNFLFHSNRHQLAQIVELIESGSVNVYLDRTFNLDQAQEALQYQKDGHSRGKNVIII